MIGTGPARLIVRPSDGAAVQVPLDALGTIAAGDLEVEITHDGDRTAWSIANRCDVPVAMDAVSFAWDAGPAGAAPCLFANGYQSWSPTGRRALGVDPDPSHAPGSIPFLRAMHHADPSIAPAGELRSEQVTVVDPGTGEPRICVGFEGGAAHAGTVRARLVEGRVELCAEAWLGGAEIAPGGRRDLHAVLSSDGDDPPALLDEWAAAAGRSEQARTAAPYQVGWCSWYHYFHEIDEAAFAGNLARAAEWPFDVFQLDDGYQAAIGDWLTTNDKFPGGVEGAATAVERSGRTPGIWMAPFLAAPDSALARAHPEWMARDPDRDDPLVGMWHDTWGGFMWQLDTTLPDVQDHLSHVARELVAAGYRYLKLDFTFSPAVPGRFADRSRTPAERVRLGYEAVRRGAGDDVFILGCGCPLGAVVGVVDAMRIGPDVAPSWEVASGDVTFAGYERAAPSTRNAWVSTLSRSFQHRRLWLNDPDCLMLRTRETDLSPDAARAWALGVGMSGGLALVSDDLALLDDSARALLDEVTALGRAADEAARTGPAPRCADLIAPGGPSQLSAAGRMLRADPDDPRARLTAR